MLVVALVTAAAVAVGSDHGGGRDWKAQGNVGNDQGSVVVRTECGSEQRRLRLGLRATAEASLGEGEI